MPGSDHKDSEFIKSLQKLIASNKLEECLCQLLTATQSNSSLQNIVVSLQSQLVALSSQNIKGVLSSDEYNKRHSQLVDHVLELIEKILKEYNNSDLGPTLDMVIILNKSIENYSDWERTKLFQAIENFLKLENGKLTIKTVGAGSVKIVIELPEDKAFELKKGIESGAFENFGVILANIETNNLKPEDFKYATIRVGNGTGNGKDGYQGTGFFLAPNLIFCCRHTLQNLLAQTDSD